ncbi:MAG: hypothetical protein V3U57_01055 [Robiginitomaculum sp.]
MKILKRLAIITSLAVLTACATATPYQPAVNGKGNGFSETKIENNRVLISFDGNSLTDRQTVETYLLYRAAELTKQKGYTYFVLTNRGTDKKTRVINTGFNDPYYGMFDYSYYHPRYGWSNPFYSPYYHPFYRTRWSHFGRAFDGYTPFRDAWGSRFNYQEITRYKASAEVRFGKGSKPENKDNAFNAKQVLDNLGEKIVYPEVKS